MSFFNIKLVPKTPTQTHTATITPATAAAVRRIIAQQGLRAADVSLLIARKPTGEFLLDLSEDLTLRNSPSYAVATSNGIVVIIPTALCAAFAKLVLDHEQGGFRFLGVGVLQSAASDPAGVELDRERLFRLSPALRSDEDAVLRTARYLREGDSRAAVVIACTPLVVAAYTDELCAVALLRFPDWLVAEHRLQIGSRLLTANSYPTGTALASDLVTGKGATGRFGNFAPLIADFISASPARVEQRKAAIDEAEWATALSLGKDAFVRARGRYRDGVPPNSATPAY